MSFSFDGANRIISCDLGVDTFSAAEIYSRWKDWVLLEDNIKFINAFDSSVGGEPIGGGAFVGQYFFLANGWKIRPQEADHTLIVEGNLFSVPNTAGLFISTIGTFNILIATRTSALTQQVLITPDPITYAPAIADAVWTEDLSNEQTVDTAGDIIKKTKTISTINLGL